MSFWSSAMHRCIRYRLLCNKLPPNSSSLNSSEHLLSHHLEGSGAQAQPRRVVLGQGLWQGCRQADRQGSVHLKVQPGLASTLSVSLPGCWRLPLLTGCWAQTFLPCPMGLSIGLYTTWQLASTRVSDPREHKK